MHAGEGTTALLLALNVFLILMAYYVLKPVREALDSRRGLGGAEDLHVGRPGGGAGVRRAAYYGRLVAQFPRMRLINVVTTFFVACLVLFYVLAQFGVPLAIVFFIWIGIFNLMIVAQFWSFANDVYSKEEGERLFVIVGFGASLGAVVGARAADRLIEPFGINQLMLRRRGDPVRPVAAHQPHRSARERARRPAGEPRRRVEEGRTRTSGQNAFAMVFRTRYLLLMALMLMLVNWVNTTGEYILGSIVKETAAQTRGDGPGRRPDRGTAHRRLLLEVLHAW